MKRDPRTQPTAGRTLDHAALLYDYLAPLMLLGSEGRLNRNVLAALDLQPGQQVLDVGCGTGSLTRMIATHPSGQPGLEVIGIDAAARMIDVAKKRARHTPNVTFDIVMAESLPYAPHSFDRAVSSLFFHHVDHAAKLASINEMARVLKPGGKALVLDVDIPTSPFGKLCAWSGYWLFNQPEIKENIVGELREVFTDSSFTRWRQLSHHTGYLSLFELTR
jgi:ubiquinone/menaquinone biosynthesis C-methylase UbiE